MSEKSDRKKGQDRTLLAGVLLREAGSALYTGLGDGREWMDLPYEEKTYWGAHAAAPVTATLLVTKPQGWEDLSMEVINTAARWVTNQKLPGNSTQEGKA